MRTDRYNNARSVARSGWRIVAVCRRGFAMMMLWCRSVLESTTSNTIRLPGEHLSVVTAPTGTEKISRVSDNDAPSLLPSRPSGPVPKRPSHDLLPIRRVQDVDQRGPTKYHPQSMSRRHSNATLDRLTYSAPESYSDACAHFIL